MSDFTANIGSMRSSASLLEGMSGSALGISEEIGDACSKAGADSESMREALNAALICGQSVREISTSFNRLRSILLNCAALYENCEEQILSSAGSALSGAFGGIKPLGSMSPFAGGAAAILTGDSFPRSGEWKIDNSKPLFDWTYRGTPGGEGTSVFTMGGAGPDNGKRSSSGKVSAVKPSGTKIYEWDAGAKASASAAEFSTKIPGGSAKASVGNAEAHASGSLSLYLTDKDGDKHIAPYASGTIGASVSLLEGSISGKVSTTLGPGGESTAGDSPLAETLGKAGISGKATGTVGKIDVSGKAAASLNDKNGKISPRISGSANAEAIAAEVSGKVSGTIMGVTATANAGLNAGIGAHASFGISPTSISCDAGASLGLGASFGFSVDISDAVDAACSSARALWNYLKPHKAAS